MNASNAAQSAANVTMSQALTKASPPSSSAATRTAPGRSITHRALRRAGDMKALRPKARNSRTKGMDIT